MLIVAPIPQQGGPKIPPNPIFLKNAKNHPKRKNSKSLEICQNQQYSLQPEISNPSGSVVSTMFCWPKNTPKPDFFKKWKKLYKTQKLKKRLEICQNQRYALQPEVSNPSGIVDSRWTKNTPKPDFFEKRKKSSKMQKLKNVQRFAKISDTSFDQRSLIHREVWFPPCFVRQNQQKTNFFAC